MAQDQAVEYHWAVDWSMREFWMISQEQFSHPHPGINVRKRLCRTPDGNLVWGDDSGVGALKFRTEAQAREFAERYAVGGWVVDGWQAPRMVAMTHSGPPPRVVPDEEFYEPVP